MRTSERMLRAGWRRDFVKGLVARERAQLSVSTILCPVPEDVLERVTAKLVSGERTNLHPVRLRMRFNESLTEIQSHLSVLLADNYVGPRGMIQPALFEEVFFIPKPPEFPENVCRVVDLVTRQTWGDTRRADTVKRFLLTLSKKGRGGIVASQSDLLPLVQAAAQLVSSEMAVIKSDALVSMAMAKLKEDNPYGGDETIGVDLLKGKLVMVGEEGYSLATQAAMLEAELDE